MPTRGAGATVKLWTRTASRRSAVPEPPAGREEGGASGSVSEPMTVYSRLARLSEHLQPIVTVEGRAFEVSHVGGVTTYRCSGSSGAVVAMLGAGGGIGQPISMLLKLSPLVSELRLYDVVRTLGVGADLSHIDSDVRGRPLASRASPASPRHVGMLTQGGCLLPSGCRQGIRWDGERPAARRT